MLSIQKIFFILTLFLNVYATAQTTPKSELQDDLSFRGLTAEVDPVVKPRGDKIQFAIDFNPLIMANQSIGINTEFLFKPHLSLGTSIEYTEQMPFDQNSVQATRNMINVAPFIRYYLLSKKLEGLFVGTKLNLTYSRAAIKDNTIKAEYNKFYVAPSVHFGVRFVADNGITVSAYAGIGIKSSSNKFPVGNIPAERASNQDWIDAMNKLNKNVSVLEPDYGLTVGYEF